MNDYNNQNENGYSDDAYRHGYENYQSGYQKTEEYRNEKKQRRERKRQEKDPNRSGFGKKILRTVAIAAVFGLVAGAVFQGSSYVTKNLLGNEDTETVSNDGKASLTTSDKKVSTTNTGSSAATVTDVSAIAEEVMPSIVAVTNVSIVQYRSWFGTQNYESTSAGSGIIVSEDDDNLYIATNNHVVSGSESLTITFIDETPVEATIVGTDSDTDLAVVAVKKADMTEDTLSAIKVATLGDSSELAVGQAAIVIGNAMGYGQSVTSGVISALDREVTISDGSNTVTNDLIQTDAAVNPGNSGGALLNLNGEVVGIVSAKYEDTSVEGMGYAIPISQAKDIIEGLMNDGVSNDSQSVSNDASGSQATGAYLGISGRDVDMSMNMQYGIPSGVYVTKVAGDSPAADAGIQKGDVIVSFDGHEISSIEEIKTVLDSHNAGDQVTVVVAQGKNDYNEATCTVTLGDKEN